MKEWREKGVSVCRLIFGYGIMLTVFAGGATFLGYLAALFIGGDGAALICEVIYKQIFPVIIKTTTCLVLFGIFTMYLAGEKGLTPNKRK